MQLLHKPFVYICSSFGSIRWTSLLFLTFTPFCKVYLIMNSDMKVGLSLPQLSDQWSQGPGSAKALIVPYLNTTVVIFSLFTPGIWYSHAVDTGVLSPFSVYFLRFFVIIRFLIWSELLYFNPFFLRHLRMTPLYLLFLSLLHWAKQKIKSYLEVFVNFEGLVLSSQMNFSS